MRFYEHLDLAGINEASQGFWTAALEAIKVQDWNALAAIGETMRRTAIATDDHIGENAACVLFGLWYAARRELGLANVWLDGAFERSYTHQENWNRVIALYYSASLYWARGQRIHSARRCQEALKLIDDLSSRLPHESPEWREVYDHLILALTNLVNTVALSESMRQIYA